MPTSKRQPRVAPKPGIYPDVPNPEYHAFNAVNASLLKEAGLERGQESWAKVRTWLDGDFEYPTHALHFGSLYHMRILEPEVYREVGIEVEKVKNPKTNRNNNISETASEQAWRIADEQNPGKVVVAPGDMDRIEGMTAALKRHPRIAEMLHLPARREVVLIWDDDETGLRCKARIDWAIGLDDPGRKGVMVDAKSCQSALPRPFERQFANYGYYLSLGFYAMGWRVYGMDVPEIVVIAQEKKAPYDVRIYRVHEQYIELGMVHARHLLNGYANCIARQHRGDPVHEAWPGLPESDEWLIAFDWQLQKFPEVTATGEGE